MLEFLDYIVERAREKQVFSREDVLTTDRVWAAILYHSGQSYPKVGLTLGHSHETVQQWYQQITELFDRKPNRHRVIAVDETMVTIEEREIFVWAAIDIDLFKVVLAEVNPGRSALDAFLFLKTVLGRCRGEAIVLVDRGPWYNWPLSDLDLPCESRREMWGERSLVEAWFFEFRYRTMLFFDRIPHCRS